MATKCQFVIHKKVYYICQKLGAGQWEPYSFQHSVRVWLPVLVLVGSGNNQVPWSSFVIHH